MKHKRTKHKKKLKYQGKNKEISLKQEAEDFRLFLQLFEDERLIPIRFMTNDKIVLYDKIKIDNRDCHLVTYLFHKVNTIPIHIDCPNIDPAGMAEITYRARPYRPKEKTPYVLTDHGRPLDIHPRKKSAYLSRGKP